MTLDERVVLIIGSQALAIARLETENEMLKAKLHENEQPYEPRETEAPE